MDLLTAEVIHFCLGLIIGLIGFYIWKDKRLILFAIAISMLIDLDHLIDYWLYLGHLSFNLREFLSGNYFCASKKFYVIFHGYEYSVILLFLAPIFKKYRAYLLIGAIAILAHLLFDVISNNMPFQSYSIIFRIINNFSF